MRPGVRDVQESGSEIGYTVGENSSEYFQFVLKPGCAIKRWEYVEINYPDHSIVGRVERITSKSDLLKDNLGYEGVDRYVRNDINEIVDICTGSTLGTVENGKLTRSRYLIRPGTTVKRAGADILIGIFNPSEESSLEIGTLVDRDDVPVSVNVNGLRRHLAIVAQTGAGKSHSAGVIMEELIKKGASVIVLDPHADYVLMRQGEGGRAYTSFIKVFRTPLSTGRYSRDNVGIVEDFTLRFSDLEPDEISDIMGIKENWTNLRKIVEDMHSSMKGMKDLEDFMMSTEKLSPEDRKKISGRIRFIKKIKSIFSTRTTGLRDYVSPGQLSIMDLSGMDQFLANYFSYRVINEIMEAKVSYDYEYPVFIFIEEAHNFIPPGTSTNVSQIIKRIAAEGRKFGVFLVVITQRPGKIDQDVLSQCNSQIILRVTNPLDKKSLMDSAESISDAIIEDLSSLETGEAILVGEFVRIPVIARIRERETEEGGGDVDISSMLIKAREERDRKNSIEDDRNRVKNIFGG